MKGKPELAGRFEGAMLELHPSLEEYKKQGILIFNYNSFRLHYIDVSDT